MLTVRVGKSITLSSTTGPVGRHEGNRVTYTGAAAHGVRRVVLRCSMFPLEVVPVGLL